MRMDLHMHSNFSDGKNSLEEMIEAAIELGYDAIAITDHVWVTSDWVTEYAKRISQLKETYRSQIMLLSGIEAKVTNLNGNIDAHPSFFSMVDLVLGSMHRIPKSKGYYHLSNLRQSAVKGSTIEPSSISKKSHNQIVDHWFQAFSNMLRNPHVDIVAHPLAELKEFGIMLSDGQKEEVAKLLVESGKIIEFNVRHQVPDQVLLNFLVLHDVPLTISSDSHSVTDLKTYGAAIRKLIESTKIKTVDISSYIEKKQKPNAF